MDGRPLLVVVMGVCGCGKSSLGAALAQRLSCPFLDADDFHPAANKEKMAQCRPLSDADRWPWLDALGHALANQGQKAGMAVAACSALKRSYRDRLVAVTGGNLRFFLLNGPKSLIAQRLSERADHFMSPALLDSQLLTLELPTAEEPAWTLDISEPLDVLVSQVQAHLSTGKHMTTSADVAVQHELS